MNFDYDFPYDASVDYSTYYYFSRAFDADEIARIHSIADTIPFQVATVESKDEDSEFLNDTRKSRVKWLPKNESTNWLYNKVGEMAIEANEALYKFDLTTMREDFQYTVYPADAGHYDWHMDNAGSGILTQRKLSCTIELSEHGEDYEGGKLQANLGSGIIEMPQGAGTAVFFPSFLLHRVTPVTQGERKSLVLWIGGDHYK
mgnify:CR=1 FL=1|jgi:PKHD-type hydroxylase